MNWHIAVKEFIINEWSPSINTTFKLDENPMTAEFYIDIWQKILCFKFASAIFLKFYVNFILIGAFDISELNVSVCVYSSHTK